MFSKTQGTHSMLNTHMAPMIGMTEGLFIFPSWVCVAVVTLFANTNQFLWAAAHTNSEPFEGRRAEMTFRRLWSSLRIGGILWLHKHFILRETKDSLLRKALLDFLVGILLINELDFVLIQLELLCLRSAKWGPTSFPSSTLSDPWEEVQKWIWLLPPHNLGSCKSFRHVLESLSETAWKFRFF